jgi:hypothetical protein
LLSVLELLDDEEEDESEEDEEDESEEDDEELLPSLSLYREGSFFPPPLRLSVL